MKRMAGAVLYVRHQAMLEEGLKKLETDQGVLGESVIDHERTLADLQVGLYMSHR